MQGLFDVFLNIPVVWRVELDDVSLLVFFFSCVSVRGCSGGHFSSAALFHGWGVTNGGWRVAGDK